MKTLLFAALLFIGQFASAADQACFYEHIDFKGAGFCVAYGRENADLSRIGWLRRISSVTIEGSATATLFSQINFGGNKATFNSSRNDLRQYGWNDVASSLRVTRNNGRVCFFQHNNWQGSSFCQVPGQQQSDLTKINWNDEISSIRVEGDASAYVYENILFGGRMLWIRNSVPALNAWNDKISSVITSPAAGR